MMDFINGDSAGGREYALLAWLSGGASVHAEISASSVADSLVLNWRSDERMMELRRITIDLATLYKREPWKKTARDNALRDRANRLWFELVFDYDLTGEDVANQMRAEIVKPPGGL